MKRNLMNYKTTVPALLAVVAVGLYWFKVIDVEQLTTGVTLLTTLGLIGAKDA
jgi:hypothetical protein